MAGVNFVINRVIVVTGITYHRDDSFRRDVIGW